jgi:hypothetical protein
MINYNLSAADFLLDSAFNHYKSTAREVKAFIVPPESFAEIEKEPDVVKYGKGRLKLTDLYLVFSMKNIEPHLVDSANQKFTLI